jgi:hypothetical protein
VDLEDQGKYLHATRSVDREHMHAAIQESISAREIDEKWSDWEGDAVVALALRLDREVDVPRLYTFLPMSETARSPFSGHVHAPFFTKLARLDISDSVALNSFLLDEAAALARDMIDELATLPEGEARSGLTIDAACWEPPDRLERAYESVGGELGKAEFVPVLGRKRWAALDATYH